MSLRSLNIKRKRVCCC